MSSLEADPEVGAPVTPPSPGGTELLEGASVALGGPRGFEVTRTLPNKHRRMVGAWCFLDAYGPHDLAGSPGMRVGPHPHIGLQTVSWLVAGEILHRDSLGTVQEIRPGQLNLMTAGRGISHSEETPAGHTGVLQGVQLWVALPDADRDVPPAFTHHADLPVLDRRRPDRDRADGRAGRRGLAGALPHPAGGRGDHPGRRHRAQALPLRPGFRVRGPGARRRRPPWTGTPLEPGPLLYLGDGPIDAEAGGRHRRPG